jgi:hypothetical protein
LLDIAVDDALGAFTVERFRYWKFFAIVEVMKVCYPSVTEPMRPSLNLIPGFPPPWGALHNIDTVAKIQLVGILFTDKSKVSSTHVIPSMRAYSQRFRVS